MLTDGINAYIVVKLDMTERCMIAVHKHRTASMFIMAACFIIIAPFTSASQALPRKKAVHVKAVRADSARGKRVQEVVAAKKPAITDSAAIVHKQVHIQAKFPGGDAEWRKFLERNLNRDIAVDKGAPPGNYTVVVSFVVGVDGTLSDIKAENNPGYGVEEEAVRVIKMSGKWQPAVWNGRKVAYRQSQSFNICMSEE